jgi:pyruvate ferredoxin oxidoreductase delta subunit
MKKQGSEVNEMTDIIVPIVFEAGNSVKNRTGLWRTMMPCVDREKCIGCMMCADLCPDSSISIIDKKAVVDLTFCKGCGICANVCPKKAIEMKLPEEG